MANKKPKPYKDILYCSNCDDDTEQLVVETGHERDSSHDTYTCLKCLYIKYGLTGNYEDYTDIDDTVISKDF